MITLDGTPLRLFLPPQWHGPPKVFYALGWRFDPELPFLARNLSRGDIIFDIGANIGAWSLVLSEAVGENGRVFAYEPTLTTYETFSRNVALNSIGNIAACRYALSNTNNKIKLYHDIDCSRNSLGHTRTTLDVLAYEEVRARTLDDLVSEHALERLDFIKIDVEGAEPLVLEGARRTLKRFKPTILFEVNPGALAELGFQHDSAWQILSDLGYRFYDLRSEALRRVLHCTTEISNLWAIHSSSGFANVEKAGP